MAVDVDSSMAQASGPQDNAPADNFVGLSPTMMGDLSSASNFNVFDFMGIGDFSTDPFFAQMQTPPGAEPTSLQTPPALAAMTNVHPQQSQASMMNTAQSYQKIFPRCLFAADFSNMDFTTNPAEALASGVPSPPAINNGNGGSGSSSGNGIMPSLTGPSESRIMGASPAGSTSSNATVRPMVTPGLTPGFGGSSPHGWMPRQKVAILPPSPQLPTRQHAHQPQQQMPQSAQAQAQAQALAQAQTQAQAQAQAQDHPMVDGGVDRPLTSKAVDGYNKASAAWLLTASNRACGCLARLYLALDSLQHLPAEIGPAMAVTRTAAHTAHDTVLCPNCSPANITDFQYKPSIQSFQNLMILGALLPSIAHAYQRIVAMVDEEAARAVAAKRKLPISLSEYGGVWGHMAVWNSMCAQTSSLDNSVVEPPLWRLVVRALLKMDVYGIHLEEADLEREEDQSTGGGENASGGADGDSNSPSDDSSRPAAGPGAAGKNEDGSKKGSTIMVPVHFGLKDIANLMESRARLRHKFMDAAYDAGLLKDTPLGTGPYAYTKLPPGEKHNCHKVIEMAKREIDQLVIV